MAWPRAHGPWVRGVAGTTSQHFSGASLGQAFDTLLSPLLCPFTDEETEALKSHQQGHAAAQRRRQGLLACSSPLVSAGSLGLSRGVRSQTPVFFPLFYFASLLRSLPLGVLPAPLIRRLCPAHAHGRPDLLPQRTGRGPLLSSLRSPSLHPLSCISSLAHHLEAGEEERPGEAGQGWPD